MTATQIEWPYLNANGGTGPLPGWGTRYWVMFANFGADGGYQNQVLPGFGDAPNITGAPGAAGSTSAIWNSNAGTQLIGAFSGGTVQITSGYGGNALSPGGNGSALIAWVGP